MSTARFNMMDGPICFTFFVPNNRRVYSCVCENTSLFGLNDADRIRECSLLHSENTFGFVK